MEIRNFTTIIGLKCQRRRLNIIIETRHSCLLSHVLSGGHRSVVEGRTLNRWNPSSNRLVVVSNRRKIHSLYVVSCYMRIPCRSAGRTPLRPDAARAH